MLPKPSWLSEPPDNWPDDAREFYRLCHSILKRASVNGIGTVEQQPPGAVPGQGRSSNCARLGDRSGSTKPTGQNRGLPDQFAQQ